MKTYSVSDNLLPYTLLVCKRDAINFTVEGRGDKGTLLGMDLSNKQFKILLEDSMCELERYSRSSKFPVYSYRTLRNKEKLRRLRGMETKTGYYVLKRDVAKRNKEN